MTHVSRREKLGPIVDKKGLFIWLFCVLLLNPSGREQRPRF